MELSISDTRIISNHPLDRPVAEHLPSADAASASIVSSNIIPQVPWYLGKLFPAACSCLWIASGNCELPSAHTKPFQTIPNVFCVWPASVSVRLLGALAFLEHCYQNCLCQYHPALSGFYQFNWYCQAVPEGIVPLGPLWSPPTVHGMVAEHVDVLLLWVASTSLTGLVIPW